MPTKPTPEVRPDAPEPEELPDWLNTTPEHEETGYHLQVDHANDGLVLQEIKLSRGEYEMLKRTIAGHRGLAPASDEPQAAPVESAAQPETAADTDSTPEPPDWLTTPEDLQYELGVVDWNGVQTNLTQILMSRSEYETLRDVLACLRIDQEIMNEAGDAPDGKQVSRLELVTLMKQLQDFLDKAPAI